MRVLGIMWMQLKAVAGADDGVDEVHHSRIS